MIQTEGFDNEIPGREELGTDGQSDLDGDGLLHPRLRLVVVAVVVGRAASMPVQLDNIVVHLEVVDLRVGNVVHVHVLDNHVRLDISARQLTVLSAHRLSLEKEGEGCRFDRFKCVVGSLTGRRIRGQVGVGLGGPIRRGLGPAAGVHFLVRLQELEDVSLVGLEEQGVVLPHILVREAESFKEDPAEKEPNPYKRGREEKEVHDSREEDDEEDGGHQLVGVAQVVCRVDEEDDGNCNHTEA